MRARSEAEKLSGGSGTGVAAVVSSRAVREGSSAKQTLEAQRRQGREPCASRWEKSHQAVARTSVPRAGCLEPGGSTRRSLSGAEQVRGEGRTGGRRILRGEAEEGLLGEVGP